MIQITVSVEGMSCGMCESHVNDAIRNAFSVRKVRSSHAKGETVILTEEDIPEEKLRAVFAETGYRALSVEKKPYEKRKGFGLWK